MPVSQRLPILCACCCLLLLATQTARADFLGVAAVVRTDLTICQDTSQDDIDKPLTVCDFFAVFNDPTDRLLSVGNSDISTSDPAGFFQHPLDALGSVVAPSCTSVGLFPDLICDSFITIGWECSPDPTAENPSPDGTKGDGSWNAFTFEFTGQILGGWFNGNPGNGQGDAGTYPNDLVLFLQIAIARGESVSGDIDVFWEDTNTGDIFAEVDMILECPGACPGDLSVDGGVGAFDLALLLGSWGENPGDPADLDGDGVVGATDLAILLGGWGPCCNSVGISDGAEPDADGDGFVDECDNCPELFNPTQNDCDENGIGDACTLADGIEGDCNENNLPDNCEDCNENDIADECDLADGTSPDCNENDIPDECDVSDGTSPDCNENGIPDECDVSDNTSPDCNENGIPDECDVSDNTSPDCNENGTPDSCDIVDGTSADCDANGAPDECQDTSTDCNDNSIWDACDLAGGTSEDCDGNFVPDECQNTTTDCNKNGIWDPCDIDEGTSPDRDGNGIPDECEENEVLYVDDDAPGDPAPGDPSESDPEEDGSPEHPFDAIQEAIDAAISGDTLLVFPGTYFENIDLLGKAVNLHSSDGPDVTTIDANGSGRVAKCISGEGPDTIIDGFTIANGSGGIYIQQSSPTIRRCIIRDNSISGRGGGVFVDGESSAIFDRCIITGNTSFNRGGGMYIGYENSSVGIYNCLITANATTLSVPGGGVYSVFGSTTIINSTIADNIAGSSGGGVNSEGGETLLSNCILWGNETGFDIWPQISFSSGAVVTIEYSTVQGGIDDIEGSGELVWGPWNIDADPSFVNPENGDFRLLHGSPCIDAGNNLAVPEDVNTDLDGGPRFLDDPSTPDTGNPDPDEPKLPIVDMGPYEYDPDDCNDNGTPDTEDLSNGTSEDCNANGIPDDCEPDCNANGQQDDCDLADGMSEDCNENGVPDECEPKIDCNLNGVQDVCDIAGGTSEDCNKNGVPDECELKDDCNKNGVPDGCDIAEGTSADCDENGVPDECELIGPVITQQPFSQEAQAGDLVIIGVIVDGILLQYQWRKDGEDLTDTERIVGAQSAGLFIFDVELTDAGEYDCIITDIWGCQIVSDPATLTVLPP